VPRDQEPRRFWSPGRPSPREAQGSGAWGFGGAVRGVYGSWVMGFRGLEALGPGAHGPKAAPSPRGNSQGDFFWGRKSPKRISQRVMPIPERVFQGPEVDGKLPDEGPQNTVLSKKYRKVPPPKLTGSCRRGARKLVRKSESPVKKLASGFFAAKNIFV